MTDKEKAHQLGEVLFDIKRHEGELRPLLVKAQRIGADLARVGGLLQSQPFGVESAENSGTPMTVGGGLFGQDRHLFDYAVIEGLERDISGHVRELHRLRQLRSKLEP